MEELKWEKISPHEREDYVIKAKYLIERKYFIIHNDIDLLAKQIWMRQQSRK